MGRAEDDVHHVRMAGHNGGQGGDDIFDAFVRREQAKAEQDDFALDAKQVFVETRVHKRHIGDAVGDEINLLRRHAIDLLQEFHAALAHDDQPIGQGRDFFQHPALIGVGVAQNGVQGRDDGHAQFAQEGQDVTARPPAEDAIFVLQADEVDVVDIQEVGGAAIRVNILLRQFKANAGRIGVAGLDVVDGQGNAGCSLVFGGDGLTQVGGERGNAALARQVVADEGNAIDR